MRQYTPIDFEREALAVDGTPGFKTLLLGRGVVCKAEETVSFIAIDDQRYAYMSEK